MAKIMFVLYRRADKSQEEFVAEWGGERHTSIARKIPGVTKWIQNPVISAPGARVCDGVGEMWFESDRTMEAAVKSPEMAAAFEDARTFLDLERSGMLVAEEKVIISRIPRSQTQREPRSCVR
jgi:uncharacterized protein (TIGR02118 family)